MKSVCISEYVKMVDKIISIDEGYTDIHNQLFEEIASKYDKGIGGLIDAWAKLIYLETSRSPFDFNGLY